MNSPIVMPLPFEENVFLVQSRSRKDILHRVECDSGLINCSCERAFARGETNCYHVIAVRIYIAGYKKGWEDSQRRLP